MTKKPSEWTPQEAWEAAVAECKRVAWGSLYHGPAIRDEVPFPADPPKRVSDEHLKMVIDGRGYWAKETILMAQELIDRRAKDPK